MRCLLSETAVKMADKGHRPAYMVPVIATPFIFALVCFFNAMAASSLGQQLGKIYLEWISCKASSITAACLHVCTIFFSSKFHIFI